MRRLALIHKVAGAKLGEEEEREAAAAAAAGEEKMGGVGKKGKKKGSGFKLNLSLLENDFDPEAWDRQMAEAFNDDYYVGGCGHAHAAHGVAAPALGGTAVLRVLSLSPSKSLRHELAWPSICFPMGAGCSGCCVLLVAVAPLLTMQSVDHAVC